MSVVVKKCFPTKRQAVVLGLLRKLHNENGGAVSAAEIGLACGRSRVSAMEILHRLHRDGLVKRVRVGRQRPAYLPIETAPAVAQAITLLKHHGEVAAADNLATYAGVNP